MHQLASPEIYTPKGHRGSPSVVTIDTKFLRTSVPLGGIFSLSNNILRDLRADLPQAELGRNIKLFLFAFILHNIPRMLKGDDFVKKAHFFIEF